MAPAFAFVLLHKMFCEELSIQLGCTVWPELLQILLGGFQVAAAWEGVQVAAAWEGMDMEVALL